MISLCRKTPTFGILDLDLVLGLDVGVGDSEPKRSALLKMAQSKQNRLNRIVRVHVQVQDEV